MADEETFAMHFGRSIFSMTSMAALVLMAIGAGWATGCGGEDERPRIEKSRLAPAQPIAETSPARRAAAAERGEALVEELVEWPEGAGEPRDAKVDYRACQTQLDSESDTRNAHPLVQLTWMRDCMTRKGWAVRPESGVPSR